MVDDFEVFQLRAYAMLRKAGWKSFDVEIIDPKRGPLIEQLATSLERMSRIAKTIKPVKQAVKNAVQSHLTHGVKAPTHEPLPVKLDRMRLASGEKDDDE